MLAVDVIMFCSVLKSIDLTNSYVHFKRIIFPMLVFLCFYGQIGLIGMAKSSRYFSDVIPSKHHKMNLTCSHKPFHGFRVILSL